MLNAQFRQNLDPTFIIEAP